MGILYVAAAFAVIPGLLAAFHLLGRPPGVTSQPARPRERSVADEAEEWLRSETAG